METFSAEVADVNPCKGVNFASNSVFGETPMFVDLGLSPAHTADKLKFIFVLATRAEELTDDTNGFLSSHGIAKVTADRVSEAKVYSDYIKISWFETMNVFERENNSGTRLDKNESQINHESRINTVSQINPES